jgi:hypothetical protein
VSTKYKNVTEKRGLILLEVLRELVDGVLGRR